MDKGIETQLELAKQTGEAISNDERTIITGVGAKESAGFGKPALSFALSWYPRQVLNLPGLTG